MIRRKNRNKIGGDWDGDEDVRGHVARAIPAPPLIPILLLILLIVLNSPANRCTRF